MNGLFRRLIALYPQKYIEKRDFVMGRQKQLAKLGDKTSFGKIVSASANIFDEGVKLAVDGDMAYCNNCKESFPIVATYKGWISEGKLVVGDGDIVLCKCKNHFVFATSHYSGCSSRERRIFSAPVSEPLQHSQVAKKAGYPESAIISAEGRPEPLPLPYVIFTTQRKMDDYDAPDMKHGDLTGEQLKDQYGLRDVSVRVNPYLAPDRKASAAVLFDEFRDLSDLHSWYGDYSSLMRKMIQHMQENSGTTFSDPLLDKAMKERILDDQSVDSTLIAIKNAIKSKVDMKNKIFPLLYKNILNQSIEGKILPKFAKAEDNVNGLGITVHDTWSTKIVLESLEISGSNYSAVIKYHIQDHFGLDDADVNSLFFKQFRIFRIWFILQRWNEYGYKPFITDISVVIEVQDVL